MPTIRPSSDLGSNYNEISALCHKYNEPIYITNEGAGDLAVMSIEAYERLVGRFELYAELEKGFRDAALGKVKPADEVLRRIESRLGDETV